MKKHNEGYSLVLVLVVLTVLSLVASFILSFSLRNLQSQTASVTRMQDEYKAAGEIEKIVAQLEAIKGETASEELTLNNATLSEGNTLAIEAQSGTVLIKCTLKLTADEVKCDTNTFTITKLTDVQYTSYEILSVPEEGGGSQ